MDQFLILFIVTLCYVLFLFIYRFLNIGRKKTCAKCNNCCPDCESSLSRIKRHSRDQMINYLTFRIFECKRYMCTECGWEGLRWEDNYKLKNN